MQFLGTSLITRSNEEFEYWIVHPYQFGFEFLDLEGSLFALVDGPITDKLIETVMFNSPLEIKEWYDRTYEKAFSNPNDNREFLVIKIVVFKENINVDFFSIGTVQHGGVAYYVSERLKKEIERMDCTGIVFVEPNESYP